MTNWLPRPQSDCSEPAPQSTTGVDSQCQDSKPGAIFFLPSRQHSFSTCSPATPTSPQIERIDRPDSPLCFSSTSSVANPVPDAKLYLHQQLGLLVSPTSSSPASLPLETSAETKSLMHSIFMQSTDDRAYGEIHAPTSEVISIRVAQRRVSSLHSISTPSSSVSSYSSSSRGSSASLRSSFRHHIPVASSATSAPSSDVVLNSKGRLSSITGKMEDKSLISRALRPYASESEANVADEKKFSKSLP
ncbi:unnamed protein product [Protopolystoma xenopodis]|uniref:Uncharacterized protein n=1 Tax=Protopolystoma xenopodis TaxID=117903 RepID=A0A448WBL1_9PLAT|nr:unnamed protein product [Protopolystoma xenopodis]